MTAKIQIRRDTISNWSGASPTATLAAGEIGVAFTAAGDVHGIKIGPSGGSNWNSLPYLNGTLPDIDVAGITDWNNAALRTTGRFIINSSFASNGPSAPIAFVADDGRITVLSLQFGTSYVHLVTTEGNGTTVPSKMLFRVYDGDATAWRSWTPLSMWSSSATTGVNVTAKSLVLKDDLTVEGDVLSPLRLPQGTVSAPSLAYSSGTNTGLFFPNATSMSVAVNGATNTLFSTGGNVQVYGNLQFDGYLFPSANGVGGSNPLNMQAKKVTNLLNAEEAQDALALVQVVGHLASNLTASTAKPLICMQVATGSAGQTNVAVNDLSGLVQWTHSFGSAAQAATIQPSIGSWIGIVLVYNGSTFQTHASFGTGSAVTSASPTTLFAAGTNSTRHILFMLRIA